MGSSLCCRIEPCKEPTLEHHDPDFPNYKDAPGAVTASFDPSSVPIIRTLVPVCQHIFFLKQDSPSDKCLCDKSPDSLKTDR